MAGLVEQIQDSDAALVERLTELAYNFEHDAILQFTQRATEEGNYFSYEFRQFLIEYARLISGDENSSFLDMVLHVVTEELDFDRAMVLLVDEDRQVLTNGRGVGGSQELTVVEEYPQR